MIVNKLIIKIIMVTTVSATGLIWGLVCVDTVNEAEQTAMTKIDEYVDYTLQDQTSLVDYTLQESTPSTEPVTTVEPIEPSISEEVYMEPIPEPEPIEPIEPPVEEVPPTEEVTINANICKNPWTWYNEEQWTFCEYQFKERG